MAIHAAIEGNPNLILLDLRFPDMNGIEVARQLQKIPETTHIPVTAWTADYRAQPNRDTLLQSGLFRLYSKSGFVARTRRLHAT
jgi:CheY-like chemotaxis protein